MIRELTAQTRLHNLKKDAKRWLKALHEGDLHARTRLAIAWPMAPREPVLRDVQHALALEYGQKSWTALKVALDDLALDQKSHAERVEQLLRHGWDGDAAAARRIAARYPDIAKESLFTAAVLGDVAEVGRRLATDPGAARKTGGSLGWTALAYVAYSRLDTMNAPAIAEKLLEAGADPNFGFDDGWGNQFKILTGAIGLGEGAKPSHAQASDLVEMLIAAGARPYDSQSLYNISIVGEPRTPALYWYDLLWRHCEAQGEIERWRTIAAGTLGYGFGLSTLDYLLGNAVGQNEIVRARWLLDRAANANTIHAYKKRPLHTVAQLSGFQEVQRLLEERGAQVVALSGLDAFVASCLCHDYEAAASQLEVNPELIRQPQPLHAAAAHGNVPAIEFLLSRGADVHALDAHGISALHRAVQAGSPRAVELLLAAGADPDLRDGKWLGTALSWSLVFNQSEIIERLIPISNDVRALAARAALDRMGTVLTQRPDLANQRLAVKDAPTPLYCLPNDEDLAEDVARLLLAHGADPKVLNAAGRSPAEVARARGLEEAAEVMEAFNREA